MDKSSSRNALKNHIKYLENVVRSTQDLLEFCAYFEDYQSPLTKFENKEDICASAINNIQKFIPIQFYAFYLVDEESFDLIPFLFHPQESKHYISDNVENLIDNGTISWALRENRAVVSFSYDYTYDILLHSMKTYSKCHGLLLCFMERHSMVLNSLNSILLTIIMKSTTYAFENFELYNTVDKKNEELHKTVKRLHYEVKQRELIEDELRRSEITYKRIFENTGNPTVIVDSTGMILLANTQFAFFSEYAREDLIKRKKIMNFISQQEKGPTVADLLNNPAQQDEKHIIECMFFSKSSVQKSVLLHLFPLGWESQFVISLSDISNIKEAEAQLNYQAYHDALTGLPNRAYLKEKLTQVLSRSHQTQASNYAVLFLDVDRLKIINDTMGHVVGDELIVQVGNKLSGCIRNVDTLARFGGDEFVIVLEKIQNAGACENVIQRIFKSFEEEIQLDGKSVYITLSIGVLLGKKEFTRPDEVIRLADLSMYQAKRMGRNKYIYYDERFSENTSKFTMEQELQKAIQKDQIYINFQPIFDLSDDSLYGLEVLARWKHDDMGLIAPDVFIPLAEDTGLIVPLGAKIFKMAFEQFQRWAEDFCFMNEIYLCLNLSVKQLLAHDFVNSLKDAVYATDMSFQNIHLEITESVFIDDNAQASEVIGELHGLGIKISIDDFGTGYSSLKYLDQYAIDLIKLDKDLIQKIGDHDKSYNIIESMLMLTKKLNIKVIAEGIEQETQLAMLKEMKCHLGQGYLFAKPQDADTIEKYLQNLITVSTN